MIIYNFVHNRTWVSLTRCRCSLPCTPNRTPLCSGPILFRADRTGRIPGCHLCSDRIHRSRRCPQDPSPRRGRRCRSVRSRPGRVQVSLPAKAAAPEETTVPTTSKRSRPGRRSCKSGGRSQRPSPTGTGRCQCSARSRGSSRSLGN